jgi:hypothetical protein
MTTSTTTTTATATAAAMQSLEIPEMVKYLPAGRYEVGGEVFSAGESRERAGRAGMPCADSATWTWTFGPGLDVEGEGQGRRVMGGKGWALGRSVGGDVVIFWFRITLYDQREVALCDLHQARRRLDDARSAVEAAREDWTITGPAYDVLRKAEVDARIDVGLAERDLDFLETRLRQEEEALEAFEG